MIAATTMLTNGALRSGAKVEIAAPAWQSPPSAMRAPCEHSDWSGPSEQRLSS